MNSGLHEVMTKSSDVSGESSLIMGLFESLVVYFHPQHQLSYIYSSGMNKIKITLVMPISLSSWLTWDDI